MTDLLATAHEAVRTLPSPLPAARGPLSAALLADLAGGSAAPIAPAAGRVMNQAMTMFDATFHRTADRRRDAPTPTIAPVMVWVEETGMPPSVAMNRVIAPPVSAQNPCAGVSRVIFDPMVWTIRQPPDSVPSAIAAWQDSTTQKGTWNSPPSSPCE